MMWNLVSFFFYQDLIDDYLEKQAKKTDELSTKAIDPTCLKWTPPAQRTPSS